MLFQGKKLVYIEVFSYICLRIAILMIFIDMEITKTYVGTMLIEDFNKLLYKERGEYLNTLEGLLVESEESFNIEEECTDINCSIEEYAQQYNYVTLEELRERMNNIQEKAQTQNADNKPNT